MTEHPGQRCMERSQRARVPGEVAGSSATGRLGTTELTGQVGPMRSIERSEDMVLIGRMGMAYAGQWLARRTAHLSAVLIHRLGVWSLRAGACAVLVVLAQSAGQTGAPAASAPAPVGGPRSADASGFAAGQAGEPRQHSDLHTGSPALDAQTLAALETALSRVNLSIADMSWDKRPIDDDFRLSCVNEALDRPLSLADFAVRAESEFAGDPVASVEAAARWLDLDAEEGGTPGVDSVVQPLATRPVNAAERQVSNPSATPTMDPAANAVTSPGLKSAKTSDADPQRKKASRQLFEFPGAPPEARKVLGIMLDAWRTAQAWREDAMRNLGPDERKLIAESGARLYTDESEDDWDMAPVLDAAKKVDISALWRAELTLARAAKQAREALAGADPSKWKTQSWRVEGITVGLGGPGPDRHTETIVLDGGGDDVYERGDAARPKEQGDRNRPTKKGESGGAAEQANTGAAGEAAKREKIASAAALGALIVDLAGDDQYRDVGGGFEAVSLILDLAGNDRYSGGDFVQGGAAFGASLLIDAAGDDRYEAGQCSQGAAFFGIGMLFDLGGSDTYRGARFVQGFGGARGLGVLSDIAGDDTYYAGGRFRHVPLLPENYQSLSQGFGFGIRGASASGGVGILADHAGNDVYSAEVYGQGASYWFSLGILADSAGHDKYNLYQYGQGAGIHLSAGILFDRAGNDAYSCNNGVAQGSGHDWGVGVLWDLAGDDYYQGSGMSQGGVNANGVGMMIDRAGNDAYSGTGDKNQGDSFFSRGTIGLGVLLDLGGRDRYTHGGKDGALWTRGTVGVGYDTEAPVATAAAVAPAPSLNESPSSASPTMSLRGSSMGAPGPKSAAAAPPPRIPVTAANAGSEEQSSAKAGTSVTAAAAGSALPASGTSGVATGAASAPGRAAKEPQDLVALWRDACLWEVGSNKEKVPAARKALIAEGARALDFMIPAKLDTKDTLITRALQVVVGGIGKSAVPKLVPCLESPSANVRRNAADLLGGLGATETAPAIAKLLDDPDARLGALSALAALKAPAAVPAIVKLMQSDAPERVRYTTAATLGAIGGDEATGALVHGLSSSAAPLRFACQFALEQLKAVGALRMKLRELAGAAPPAGSGPAGRASGTDSSAQTNPADQHARLHVIAALGHIAAADRSAGEGGEGAAGSGNAADRAAAVLRDLAATRDDLVPLLSDPDPVVRGYAVEAIGAMLQASDRDRLRALLGSEKDPFVHTKIEEALAR